MQIKTYPELLHPNIILYVLSCFTTANIRVYLPLEFGRALQPVVYDGLGHSDAVLVGRLFVQEALGWTGDGGISSRHR